MNFNNLKTIFLNLSTPEISDAMDFLKMENGTIPNIKPLKIGFKMFGKAYTVQYGELDEHMVKAGDYIDSVTCDNIVVIDNKSKMSSTVWGGILTQISKSKNIQGTLINGVCRDVDDIIESDYPVFSLGTNCVTNKGRGKLLSTNEELNIFNIAIKPDDYIFGDSNGVMVIPSNNIEIIVKTAKLKEVERKILNLVLNEGWKLSDARHHLNYNVYGKQDSK